VSPDSISWRVFKDPLSLFIGGAAAVIMELAESRGRTGVWEHPTFRADPIRRVRRKGLVAMLTVYGARSTADENVEPYLKPGNDEISSLSVSFNRMRESLEHAMATIR
jgi:uncharacterized protein (DUF2236 family)